MYHPDYDIYLYLSRDVLLYPEVEQEHAFRYRLTSFCLREKNRGIG